jgi:hypothetical protein
MPGGLGPCCALAKDGSLRLAKLLGLVLWIFKSNFGTFLSVIIIGPPCNYTYTQPAGTSYYHFSAFQKPAHEVFAFHQTTSPTSPYVSIRHESVSQGLQCTSSTIHTTFTLFAFTQTDCLIADQGLGPRLCQKSRPATPPHIKNPHTNPLHLSLSLPARIEG